MNKLILAASVVGTALRAWWASRLCATVIESRTCWFNLAAIGLSTCGVIRTGWLSFCLLALANVGWYVLTKSKRGVE